MLTVLAAVATYTLVVLVLVSVLMLVRRFVVPSGVVTVAVSGGGDHDLTTEVGSTLLAAFNRAGIHFPAACGGRGTCGTCRVKVTRGGGPFLPTEGAHIGRAEAREGWRLACQVRMRDDIAVEVPQEIFAAGRWQCRVRSANNVASFIREIVFGLPEGEEIDFRAGSYVQVECPPYRVCFEDLPVEEEFRAEWDRHGLWELEASSDEHVVRAYSLANPPYERRILMLNVRIATPPPDSAEAPPGVVSSYLFSLRPGDELTITGPFGDFFARDSDAEMIYVGGGAGMAPMRSHILDQLQRLGTHRKISFWYGARSVREIFYADLFHRLAAKHDNFEWHVALSDPQPEDEWDGHTGFIHQVLYDHYLGTHPAPEEVEYYLCGPPVMLAACRKMLDDLGVEPDNIFFDDFGS
jgi:Na+-transporting NADH:ubiquinone oxidoreductase subunit F